MMSRKEPVGLHSIETASHDELQALQFSQLRQTLHHVFKHSPVYKEKFKAHHVHPDDFRSLDDLARFPFTTKQDFRDNYPYGMFSLPMNQIIRIHASSGTTGHPTVVGYSKNDIETWSDVMARSIYAAGGRPGDKVHVAYGYGLFTGGLGAHYGAEKLGCVAIPMSSGQTRRQASLMADLDPDIIMVTPSYMLNIADELDRQGIDPHKLALRCGIFGAEPWTGAMCDELQQRLGIDAVDIYGLSEIIGPGVAQECVESRSGLTIWEDHFYPEIIDPKTGENLPDGELGELVFTTLSRDGMPIVRYRTRDLTRLLPGNARTMRCMEKITGRSDDMLIIRGVNVFPTQIEEQLLAITELAPHYEIKVFRQGHLDAVSKHVEGRSGVAPEYLQTAGERLFEAVRSYVGIRAIIKVTPAGTIARSEGKAKRVIDTRKLS